MDQTVRNIVRLFIMILDYMSVMNREDLLVNHQIPQVYKVALMMRPQYNDSVETKSNFTLALKCALMRIISDKILLKHSHLIDLDVGSDAH